MKSNKILSSHSNVIIQLVIVYVHFEDQLYQFFSFSVLSVKKYMKNVQQSHLVQVLEEIPIEVQSYLCLLYKTETCSCYFCHLEIVYE